MLTARINIRVMSPHFRTKLCDEDKVGTGGIVNGQATDYCEVHCFLLLWVSAFSTIAKYCCEDNVRTVVIWFGRG